MKKILMLYGQQYPSAIGQLTEIAHRIDQTIIIDFIRDPIEALKNIENYDMLIMGLIWSQYESQNLIENENLGALLKLKTTDHDMTYIGTLLYDLTQKKVPIKTIIYDTVLSSKSFANSKGILFIRMPETAENIVSYLQREGDCFYVSFFFFTIFSKLDKLGGYGYVRIIDV